MDLTYAVGGRVVDRDWGVFLSAYGEIWCPPVGNSVSASGEFPLSALSRLSAQLLYGGLRAAITI